MRAIRLLLIMACFGALVIPCACHRMHEGPYAGKAIGEFAEKQTVYFFEQENGSGGKLSKVVSIDGQQYQKLPHGALKVDTIVRNRLKKAVAIECSTEFKDAKFFGVNDATGWEVLVLQPLESRTYTSLSTNTTAEHFTVRIRAATK